MSARSKRRFSGFRPDHSLSYILNHKQEEKQQIKWKQSVAANYVAAKMKINAKDDVIE